MKNLKRKIRRNFSNGPLQYLGGEFFDIRISDQNEVNFKRHPYVNLSPELVILDNMGANEALKGMNLHNIGPMLRGECEWGGRDRKRWGRLVTFYFFYYIAIFGLFFLVQIKDYLLCKTYIILQSTMLGRTLPATDM